MSIEHRMPPDTRTRALEMQAAGEGWISLADGVWSWNWGARPADAAVVKLNESTPEGKFVGSVLAKLCDKAEARLRAETGPTPERCQDCAARAGTFPNGCVATLDAFMEALASGDPFYCHAGIDLDKDPNPDPQLICRGWIALARPEDVERVANVIATAKAGG